MSVIGGLFLGDLITVKLLGAMEHSRAKVEDWSYRM